MRVLLTGATGTLGSALIPRLVHAGHSVLALTRTPDAVARLRDAGVHAVVVDVMDGNGLLQALGGHGADAVIHQATAITRTPTRHHHLDATDALRAVGTRNLLRAPRCSARAGSSPSRSSSAKGGGITGPNRSPRTIRSPCSTAAPSIGTSDPSAATRTRCWARSAWPAWPCGTGCSTGRSRPPCA
ncbi:NAD-dependent epimerase/dehydratase family protein [Pseudonocardia nigra]|uniref:NAD-dependent epimerase/dehydratase family protein n=1 Tax=Pseudonocardia nigra TaxID=1921578 RepID=UPI001C602928|nr:NAD(P)-dependent oxidoreductase [Pseudonocardia nigra]